jgi:hypothetical protein
MDVLQRPSVIKYIGVYLLAVFSANILATILLSLASDQFLISSVGFFIIASAEVAILFYVITFVYSKFLDLDMNKVVPWIIGLMILKYIMLISDLSQYKSVFPNYTFLLICIILQPVALYILLKNHFVKNGRIN